MRYAWLALLVACGSQRRGQPIAGPMELSAEEAQGQRTFMESCHQCHPGGEAGLGPTLTSSPTPVWLQRQQVRLGAGAMPAFGPQELPKQELDALAAYLRALKKHKP